MIGSEQSFRNIQRMQECPHFDYCETVKCPLDELMQRRVKLCENKARCRLSKTRRMRLGRDMETKGLNCYEIAALVRTYGSSEKGIKAILSRNFNRKNRRKNFKRVNSTPGQK